jgi:glutamate carboxypeptidase
MMPSLERLIEAVHMRVPEMHRRMRAWVEVNSHSANVPGVNAVGALLQAAFQWRGVEAHRQPGGRGSGDHLFWMTHAARQHPPVLLIGHHDTVFPPGQFESWHEDQGRARGPGCVDMKGGLAVIWGALDTLADAQLLERLPVVVASVGDEEVGSLDSRSHLEALARTAACALVFESGRPGDHIVTRRRGTGNLRVMATGKAAHAGNAHRQGANAIWALARFIDLAQAETDYARGLTVSVGTVLGGSATNTVPASAEAQLDLRFESISEARGLLERLEQAAARAALPGTRLRLEGGINRPPLEKTEASAELYRAYGECQRAAGLGHGEQPLVGGGSDANTVAGVGVPAIDGLGPRGGEAHTFDEYVELDSFGPKAEALVRFLWSKLV